MPEQTHETTPSEGGSPVNTPYDSRLVEPQKSPNRVGAVMPREGEYPDETPPLKATGGEESPRIRDGGRLTEPPASLPVHCPHCGDTILQIEEYCTSCHDYCCMECQDSDGNGPCCQINLGGAA